MGKLASFRWLTGLVAMMGSFSSAIALPVLTSSQQLGVKLGDDARLSVSGQLMTIADPASGTVFVTDMALSAGQLKPINVRQANWGKSPKLVRAIPLGQKRFLLLNQGEAIVSLVLPNGRILKFGGIGSEEGRLREPRDMALSPQGRVYVADQGNHRVSVFSLDGVFYQAIDQGADKQVRSGFDPKAVGVDRNERVFALDPARGGTVYVFSHTGKAQGSFSAHSVGATIGRKAFRIDRLAVREDGLLALVDRRASIIVLYDPDRSKVQGTLGSKGDGPGQYRSIADVAFVGEQGLVVLDSERRKLDRYDLQIPVRNQQVPAHDLMSVSLSSVLKSPCPYPIVISKKRELCLWQEKAALRSFDGKHRQPLEGKWDRIVAADHDRLMMVLLGRRQLRGYDLDGHPMFTAGGAGKGAGEFEDPADVALGSQIYVADRGNSRIQVFTRRGRFLKTLESKDGLKLFKPSRIAVSKDQRVLYVADEKTGTVLAYGLNKHTVLYVLGKDLPGGQSFRRIDDLFLDDQGRLYVFAATRQSPPAIWIFKNDSLVFRFSPSDKPATLGVDPYWFARWIPKTRTPVDNLVGFTQDTLNRFTELAESLAMGTFSLVKEALLGKEHAWRFDLFPELRSSIVLVNTKKELRQTFLILQPPPPVNGLEVLGDEEHVLLGWNDVASAHSYRIYGESSLGGLRFLGEVQEPQFQMKRDFSAEHPVAYWVQAVSDAGKRGLPSSKAIDHYHLALRAERNQQTDEMVEWLRRAVDAYPHHAAALQMLALREKRQGLFQEALLHLRQLSGIESASSWARHQMAEIFLITGTPNDALRSLVPLLKSGNAGVRTYLLGARARWMQGDTLAAIGLMDQGLERWPDNVELLVQRSRLLYRLGDREKAVAQLDQARKQARSDHDWLVLGRAYELLKKPDQAKACFFKGLNSSPGNGAIIEALTSLLLRLGAMEDIRALTSLLAKQGVGSEAWVRYVTGRKLVAQGDRVGGLLELRRAYELDQKNLWIALGLGNALVDAGRYGESRTYFERILQHEEGHAAALLGLARSCQGTANKECTRENLMRALRLHPDDLPVRIEVARWFLHENMLAEARKHAEQALSQDPSNSTALMILARVDRESGDLSSAVNHLRAAVKNLPESTDLRLELARALFAMRSYQAAWNELRQVQKIRPEWVEAQVLAAEILVAQREFKRAQSLIDAALAKHPDPRLERVRQEIKAQLATVSSGAKVADSIRFEGFHPFPVFAGQYKIYQSRPVAEVAIKNIGGVPLRHVQLSFVMPQFMTYPSVATLESLMPGETRNVSLRAVFATKIVALDESLDAAAEVTAQYRLGGIQKRQSMHGTVHILERNAILWSQPDSVASFVTPKDRPLRDFVRESINQLMPNEQFVVPSLVKAMTVFETLRSLPVRYVEDANTPYSKLKKDQLDTVQFPRETLHLKSGDCDDLSVLLSAALESLGIETALVDVPGHIFMMFNTGLQPTEISLITSRPDMVPVVHGTLWVPIEATLLKGGFSEAWVEGAKKYREAEARGEANLIFLHHAWMSYPPATLPETRERVDLPPRAQAGNLIAAEYRRLKAQAVDRLVLPFRYMLAINPVDLDARMQIAIIYGKFGMYADAVRELEAILARDATMAAAHINLGNVHFLQEKYDTAIQDYRRALEIEPDNPNAWINLSMAQWKIGDVAKAKKSLTKATALQPSYARSHSQLLDLVLH